ncbi:hypothetical protein K474DRAFT_1712988 [Panus rudis PR-1116 ss-1]|nr:hypothetical protein K474DRAFT_1712988 [Panus rudis PR-1116 ss-1]
MPACSISTMDMFSSVTIHGIVETSNGKPTPFTLKRDTSFPPQLWCHSRPATHVWRHDMRPQTSPAQGKHIELRLSEYLGRGRTGHVYEAQVIGVSSGIDIPTSPPDFPLPPLCIKLAEPNRLRSVAREAWFYEKLDTAGLQGTVVPRAFGFFTAQCSLSQVIPWHEPNWEFHDDIESLWCIMKRLRCPTKWKSVPSKIPDKVWQYEDIEDVVDREDSLRFEPEDWGSFASVHRDDEYESNTKSPWKCWNWRICDPQDFGILVMEKLGESMVPTASGKTNQSI